VEVDREGVTLMGKTRRDEAESSVEERSNKIFSQSAVRRKSLASRHCAGCYGRIWISHADGWGSIKPLSQQYHGRRLGKAACLLWGNGQQTSVLGVKSGRHQS